MSNVSRVQCEYVYVVEKAGGVVRIGVCGGERLLSESRGFYWKCRSKVEVQAGVGGGFLFGEIGSLIYT